MKFLDKMASAWRTYNDFDEEWTRRELARQELEIENALRASQKIPVKSLHPNARLPTRGSPGAAGMDLHAVERYLIPAGDQVTVSTGIAVQTPENCAGLIWPRSGLAAKWCLDVMGGVIDSDYTGEVKVILRNHAKEVDYQIEVGDRIAQLVIQPVQIMTANEVGFFAPTKRGGMGFGSTGVY